MSRLPPAVKIWSLILSVTVGYGLIGQVLPQAEIGPPADLSSLSARGTPTANPRTGALAEGNGSGQPAGFGEGRGLYRTTCVLCHGERGEGNVALNAPRLAGQDAWYIERQLENFASGVRGGDPGDIYGMQMRPMVMDLTQGEMEDLATYISALE